MNNKLFTPVLAIVLLVCFFLPYFSNGLESFSAFNIVFGKHGLSGVGSAERYLWLLIPLAALLLLFGGNTSGGFTYWIPLIGLVYIIVRIYIEANSIGSAGIGDILKIASYGFWISLGAAILLPFSKSR
jgi:hypothetical protein